jgi:hypothetical protein
MKAMLGGLDPSDPKAAEELAARLRRQAGFKSVVYKGNGLYEVDFAVSGQLSHDFAFPTIEKMPQITPFPWFAGSILRRCRRRKGQAECRAKATPEEAAKISRHAGARRCQCPKPNHPSPARCMPRWRRAAHRTGRLQGLGPLRPDLCRTGRGHGGGGRVHEERLLLVRSRTGPRTGQSGRPRALVVNAGNSNAFTGYRGREAVEQIMAQVAAHLGCSSEVCSSRPPG